MLEVHQGKGYCTEAARALIAWAFQHRTVHTIMAIVAARRSFFLRFTIKLAASSVRIVCSWSWVLVKYQLLNTTTAFLAEREGFYPPHFPQVVDYQAI